MEIIMENFCHGNFVPQPTTVIIEKNMRSSSYQAVYMPVTNCTAAAGFEWISRLIY